MGLERHPRTREGRSGAATCPLTRGEGVGGDVDPDRQRHRAAQARELGVQSTESDVEVHADRGVPVHQRGDHRPRLEERGGEKDIGDGDAVVRPRPGQVALGIDQRRHRGAVGEGDGELHRPGPGPGPVLAHGHHRDSTVAAGRGPTVRRPQESDDPPVRLEVPGQHRPGEDEAFQRPAAAQRHVELPRHERAAAEVHDDPVQGLTLALVDGHRPGEGERELGEGPDHLVSHTAAVRHRSGDVPGVERDLGDLTAGEGDDDDGSSLSAVAPSPEGHIEHPSDGSVHPTVRRVIGEHHDLRADLEPQHLPGGELEPGEIAGESRLHRQFRPG